MPEFPDGHYEKVDKCQALWHMPRIPALKRKRQEDLKF
jgi:hypothetical protein